MKISADEIASVIQQEITNFESEIDVRDFIQKNYMPYEGDASFLVGSTERASEISLVPVFV